MPSTQSADPITGSAVKTKQRRRSPSPRSPEVRFLAAQHLEVRAASAANPDEIVLTGSPIVYDQPYTVCDLFGEFEERMDAGVVTELLASQPDVRFLFNHDGMPLARTTSGTLTLSDTPGALTFEARLDGRQQLAQDLSVAIERGDVSQMSIGFSVAPGGDTWNADMDQRQIHRLGALLDVSAVTYPASPTTHIDVAQRMVMAMPIESRARADKMYAEIRAGKTLSQSNADKITAAAQTLHDVLATGGADFTNSFPDDESEDDGLDVVAMEDGTEGESAEMAPNTDVADLSATRSAAMALELELLELESRSAAVA